MLLNEKKNFALQFVELFVRKDVVFSILELFESQQDI